MAGHRTGTDDRPCRAAQGRKDFRPSEPFFFFFAKGSLSCVDGYHDLPKFIGLHEWDVQCQSSFTRVPTFADLIRDHDFGVLLS